MKRKGKGGTVMKLEDKLALALRATAASYRHCDPRPDDVLDTLAEFIEQPKSAQQLLRDEAKTMKHLGIIR